MATMLPIQGCFDKDIPQDYGNAEYLQEHELLIAINDIIALSDLERPVRVGCHDVCNPLW